MKPADDFDGWHNFFAGLIAANEDYDTYFPA
jgi:hypothetical protein